MMPVHEPGWGRMGKGLLMVTLQPTAAGYGSRETGAEGQGGAPILSDPKSANAICIKGSSDSLSKLGHF